MGRLQTSIPEDLDKRLRREAARRFEWRKGSLKRALAEAIDLWLSQEPKMLRVEDPLRVLEERGVIDESFIGEVLRQKTVFEDNRRGLGEKNYGKTVVVCGGDVFVGEGFEDALRKARKKHGNRPYYSESIGVIDYPSVHL